VTRMCALIVLALLLFAVLPAAAELELRTWSIPVAAPANGSPVSESTSFTMRARVGGPFAGYAESGSFSLWGCSAYTPVECVLFATLAGDGDVVVRWQVATLTNIAGFNLYRSLHEAGPYELLNEELLPAESPGEYEDDTAWPATEYWYDLRVVLTSGTEEPVLGG